MAEDDRVFPREAGQVVFLRVGYGKRPTSRNADVGRLRFGLSALPMVLP